VRRMPSARHGWWWALEQVHAVTEFAEVVQEALEAHRCRASVFMDLQKLQVHEIGWVQSGGTIKEQIRT
jgi:hypothetical protein